MEGKRDQSASIVANKNEKRITSPAVKLKQSEKETNQPNSRKEGGAEGETTCPPVR